MNQLYSKVLYRVKKKKEKKKKSTILTTLGDQIFLRRSILHSLLGKTTIIHSRSLSGLIISHMPCKQRVMCLILGFSSLWKETF